MLQHLAHSPRAPAVFLLTTLCVALCCALALSPRAALASVKCQDNYEPNNYFAQAPQLNVNSGYSAAICDSSDVDYYAFWVDSGYHIRASIYSLPTDFDLVLFDSEYNVVGSSSKSGTTDDIVNYDVWNGGWFYMSVHGKKGEYSDDPYSFRMDVWYNATQTPTPAPTLMPTETSTPTPTATGTRTRTPTPTGTVACPDPYEPNDSFETAWFIAPDEYSSYICERTDQDWFQFEVQLHDTVEITLKNLPGNYDLYVYDGAHNEQGRSENPGTTDEYVAVSDAKVAGAYRVLVGTKTDSSGTTPYVLRLRIHHGGTATPTYTPTAPACNTDPSEPNDTFATAHIIWPGGWTQGLICPPGDVDFWKFAVAAGHTIRLELRSLPADYDLYLWSPAGVEVEHSWNSGTSDELILYHALQSGDWRAEVRPVYGQWHGTDPYDLRPDVYATTATPTLTPTRTRTATPSPTPSPTLGPSVDLRINYIEVNQAIQTVPPVFDPIARKPTVVRVYISTGLPWYSPCVRGVTAKLDIRDAYGGPVLHTFLPYNPGGMICADPSPDWHELNDSLNFELPTYLLQGSWTLQPDVNYDHTVLETNFNNNRDMTQVIRFRTVAKRLTIHYRPIHHVLGALTRIPTDAIDRSAGVLKTVWPVRPDYVHYSRGFPLVTDEDVSTVDGRSEVLDQLEESWAEMGPRRPEHVLGWLPGTLNTGSTGGLAHVGTYADQKHGAWCKDYWIRDTCVPHELMHNYGFEHVCNPVLGRGFDTLNRVVRSDTLTEIMCDSIGDVNYNWINVGEYNSMYQQWASALGGLSWRLETAPAAVPSAYVIASGVITTSGESRSGMLKALQIITSSQAFDAPTGGAYCLEFQAANQTVLQNSCFEVTEAAAGGLTTTQDTFVLVLPWPANTTRVLLKYGQTTLHERWASANRPTVQVVSPGGGETWDGTRTATWTGSDADGDALTYAVLYTKDAGTSWEPLSTGLITTALSVDTSYLAGGEQCQLKVRVSDGFYNTEDLSEPFSVPRKPPEPVIGAPAEGAWYRPTNLVTLMGQAYDPEDGMLPDGQLLWFLWTPESSIGLGSGPLVSAGPLEPGEHVIVLDVVDSDGNEAVQSRTIHVGERTANTVYLPAVVKR